MAKSDRVKIAVLILLMSIAACFPQLTHAAYGPDNETECTTIGDIIVQPGGNPESAVEGNTNSVILIRGGTYNVNNFVVGSGNTVRNYNCETVNINLSSSMTVTTSNWTVAGLKMDWGNTGNGGWQIQGSASGWELRNNHIIAEHDFRLDGTANNGIIRGNILEFCPGCVNWENLLDDNGSSGQFNILIEGNKFIGAANNNEGHDTIAVTGLVAGTLSSMKTGANDCSLLIRRNLFECRPGGNCGENWMDVKVFGDIPNPGRVCVEQNTLGPLYGTQTSENMGIGINFGDSGCTAGGGTKCPEHLVTHNAFLDVHGPDESGGEERSSAVLGGTRYTSARVEFNVINNSETFATGRWQNLAGVTIIHNSYFNDTLRFGGNSCTDTISGGGVTLGFYKNAMVNSLINESCGSTPNDWAVNHNMFFNTSGGNLQDAWGVGNSDGVNPSYANVGANDFTITASGNTSDGIPRNELGALPVPQIDSAAIGDNCILVVTMEDSAESTALGYSHMPMSAVDHSKVTVRYGGTGQTINSSQVSGNDVRLNMAVCPASTDTVTFDATVGWCRDSADIGDLDDTRITAGCEPVTGQSVTNNVQDEEPTGPLRLASVGGSSTGNCMVTPCHLQRAIEQASCGDTVLVADGIYNGGYNISGPNCSSGNRLTIKAENRWGAILRGSTASSESNRGFFINRDWYVIDGFRFERYGIGLEVNAQAANNQFVNNFFCCMVEDAVELEGGSNTFRHNVLGYLNANAVSSRDLWGIDINGGNADNNIIENNIWVGWTRDDMLPFFSQGASAIGIRDRGANGNKIRGNIILVSGEKDSIRFFLTQNNDATDNVVAYTQSNTFSFRDGAHNNLGQNNFAFRNSTGWGGKGNCPQNWSCGGASPCDTGPPNKYYHNTAIIDEYTNEGGVRTARDQQGGGSGGANCTDGGMQFRSNVVANLSTPTGSGQLRNGYVAQIAQINQIMSGGGAFDKNMWWINNENLNTSQYFLTNANNCDGSFDGGPNALFSQPVFVGGGDYSLTPGSPGSTDGSFMTKRGINYNDYLTAAKVRFVTNLPLIREAKDSATAHTFNNVDNGREYFVMARYPSSGSCNSTNEQFTIEGQGGGFLNRDYAVLKSTHFPCGNYTGSVHRWIYLGTHSTNDGVLNVDWQTASCVDELAAVALPTPEEAYQAIRGEAAQEVSTPTGVVATTGDTEEIDIDWDSQPGVTFNIYRSERIDGAYALIDSGIAASNYTDDGVTANDVKCYKVSAVGAEGESLQSEASCAPTTLALPIRLNAGGWDYLSVGGNVYFPDRAFTTGGMGYVGGQEGSKTHEIANTAEDDLYRFYHWGETMEYRFTVPNGTYTVILLQYETFRTANGQRVFDVRIEGNTVLNDYDIHSEVGFATATSKAFGGIDVNDGVLNIEWDATPPDGADSGVISAIFIDSEGETPDPITETFNVSADAHACEVPALCFWGLQDYIPVTHRTGQEFRAWLRFNLANISFEDVGSATLEINVGAVPEAVIIRAHASTDAWSEGGIHQIDDIPLGDVQDDTLISATGAAEFDVTDAVRDAVEGDKVVTIVLREPSSLNRGIIFNSRESIQGGAKLTVTQSPPN